MSSGRRVVVTNTQERAISTDINRLQAFSNREAQEVLRYLMSGQYGDELAPGQVLYPTGFTTPLTAEIIGGLMVRPTTGSFEVQVDAGLLCAIAPGVDPEPDDSEYKYARSSGVGAAVLAIGANASGLIRIDVVECRIDPIPETVSDNRDIFDEVTGLFSAVSVTKELGGKLEFRIRAGTGGGGYPGAVSGWLPLAIASVPSGAASNDDVTFWDVRPLLQDRESTAFQQFPAIGFGRPHLLDLDVRLDRTSSSNVLANGSWRGTLKGRRVGGQFRRGTPGTESLTDVNLADADNHSGTIAEPLTGIAYLYALQPFGLPRWAKYEDAPFSRIPHSPIGMLVLSYVLPDAFGQPASTISIPTSTGLGGSCDREDAACVMAVPPNLSDNYARFQATNRTQMGHEQFGNSVVSAAFSILDYDFTVTAAEWPPNAKAAIVRVGVQVNVPANSANRFAPEFHLFDTAATTGPYARIRCETRTLTNADAGAQDMRFSLVARLPLPVAYPSAPTTPRLLRLHFTEASSDGGTFGTPAATAALSFDGFEY